MKLNLEQILSKTNEIYKQRKLDAGLNPDNICNVELHSDQVKALAQALVEAINREFSEMPSYIKRG